MCCFNPRWSRNFCTKKQTIIITSMLAGWIFILVSWHEFPNQMIGLGPLWAIIQTWFLCLQIKETINLILIWSLYLFFNCLVLLFIYVSWFQYQTLRFKPGWNLRILSGRKSHDHKFAQDLWIQNPRFWDLLKNIPE